ncbi:hypothetical protein [Salinicoccus kekensis]|uniref:Uncharacterized protein n=1 Tax=Salinicoccus kekensis TaxID=714307 RepID=A0A285UPC4_9STAP|nr:hypothetical protein [Salinicoccus kekensis]SOC43603.1 hypothetical protein SAMN05878391_2037 [Salinicoccus kekensis]
MSNKEIETSRLNVNKLSDAEYVKGKYIKRENEVNDLLINKQQLYHLLMHGELQAEELEGL